MQAHEQSSSSINIVVICRRTLQAAASTILSSGSSPLLSTQSLSYQPLLIHGAVSRVRIAFCSLWAQAAAVPNTRVLWIPALHSYIGQVVPINQQEWVVSRLLAGFRQSPQLYPPLSWSAFERKDQLYQEMGSPIMLDSLWIPLASSSDAALQAAETQLLHGRTRGEWIIKGGYSHGGRTTHRITAAQHLQQHDQGVCIPLTRILRSCFITHHQRIIGIQPFVPSLRNSEQRVFIVPDKQAAGGWRQCVSIHSQSASPDSFSVHTVHLRLPTSGVPKRIAGFIDQLLLTRAHFFSRVQAAGMPLLRLDCGYSNRYGCFLNEISSAGNATLFTDVHEQDLALVAARCFAEQMWAMM